MKQTLIKSTDYIRNLLNNVKGDLLSILEYQKNLNLQNKHELINQLFNQRTAEQILKDGFTTGCTDDAIVFTALTKASSLKPIYIEALEKNWLETPMEEDKIKGHAFVELEGKLIDPQRKIIFDDPNHINERYVVYAKGNEPYDFGLTDFGTSMKKFVEFKEKYQKEKIRP